MYARAPRNCDIKVYRMYVQRCFNFYIQIMLEIVYIYMIVCFALKQFSREVIETVSIYYLIRSFPLNSKHGRFILNCLHDRTASLSFRKKTSGITLATSAARATERYRSRMREKSFAMLVSLSLFLSLSFGPESGKVLEEERRRVVLTKNGDDCWRGEVEDESPKGDIEKEGRGKRSS